MAGAKGSMQSKAFSGEVDTGSGKENASNYESSAPFAPGPRADCAARLASFPVETANAPP
jgi:hypothetical protein